MKRILTAWIIVASLIGILNVGAGPAFAGIGGSRYIAVSGTINNGTVAWAIRNYWHTQANTSSEELGPFTVPMLRTVNPVTITDPAPLTPGQCDTLTLTGTWADGYTLTGSLTATVCAPAPTVLASDWTS